MAYNQAIAHVNNTDQLLAQQQKERNAEIEHEKQLAATHRNYAQSYSDGLVVEGKARDIAIQFDHSFRKVNYELELQGIQAAHDSAIRNATQAAQGKAKQTQQVVNFVTQTLDTGVQIAKNIETGRQKQIETDAAAFNRKYKPGMEFLANLNQINLAFDIENSEQDSAAKQQYLSTQDPLMVERWQSFNSATQVAVANLILKREIDNLALNAYQDPDTKINGLTYAQAVEGQNGVSDVATGLAHLRQRERSLFRIIEQSGIKVNPALHSDSFEKLLATEANKIRRNAGTAVIEDQKYEHLQVTQEKMQRGGATLLGKIWDGVSKEHRTDIIQRDFQALETMAKSGSLNDEQITDIANIELNVGGKIMKLSDHAGLRVHLTKLIKARNEFKNLGLATRKHQLQQQSMQAMQLVNTLRAGPTPTNAEINQLEQTLDEELGPDHLHANRIKAVLQGMRDKNDASASSKQIEQARQATNQSGFLPETTIETIGRGDPNAIQNGKIQAAKDLQNNKKWKHQQKLIEALIRDVGKFGDKQVTSSTEFLRKRSALEKIYFNDVVRYLGENKGIDYAYAMADANFADLEKAAKANPLGNHVLRVVDKANPGDSLPGQIFYDTEIDDVKIQPTSSITSRDLTTTFQSLGVNKPHFASKDKMLETLKSNPKDFHFITSDRAQDFYRNMNNPSVPPQMHNIRLFTKVADLIGTTPSEAAKIILESRGDSVPENRTQEKIDNLLQQAGINGMQVQQIGGWNNTLNYLRGQAPVRGESVEATYTGDRDRQETGTDVVFNGGLNAPLVLNIPARMGEPEDGYPAVHTEPDTGAKSFGHTVSVIVTLPNGNEVDFFIGHLHEPSPLAGFKGSIPAGTRLGGQGMSGSTSGVPVATMHANGRNGYKATPEDLMWIIRNMQGISGGNQQPQQPPLNERQSIGELPIVSDGEMPTVKPPVDPLNNPEEAKSSYRLGGDKIITKLPDGSYAVRHWVNGNWSDPVALNQDEGKTMYEQGRYLATKGVTNQ